MRAPDTLALAFPEPAARRLTGTLEQDVQAALARGASRPERVTQLLSVVFDRVGDLPASVQTLRKLATGPREWLLQQAALLFSEDTGWFESTCAQCGARYDIPLRLRDAPTSAPGPGFPVAEVETSLGPRSFEVPNGACEEALSRSDHGDARDLLAICGLSDAAGRDARAFTDDDLQTIEEALDAMAPDVASELEVPCPDCNQTTKAVIDPLAFAFPSASGLLDDVHVIAGQYGWSEADIFDLPSHRRRHYAALIRQDRAAGVRPR